MRKDKRKFTIPEMLVRDGKWPNDRGPRVYMKKLSEAQKIMRRKPSYTSTTYEAPYTGKINKVEACWLTKDLRFTK